MCGYILEVFVTLLSSAWDSLKDSGVPVIYFFSTNVDVKLFAEVFPEWVGPDDKHSLNSFFLDS